MQFPNSSGDNSTGGFGIWPWVPSKKWDGAIVKLHGQHTCWENRLYPLVIWQFAMENHLFLWRLMSLGISSKFRLGPWLPWRTVSHNQRVYQNYHRFLASGKLTVCYWKWPFNHLVRWFTYSKHGDVPSFFANVYQAEIYRLDWMTRTTIDTTQRGRPNDHGTSWVEHIPDSLDQSSGRFGVSDFRIK